LRAFPDTNVLFSALASRGLCADLLRSLLTEHDVIVGEPVLEELRRNLQRKLLVPAERIALATGFLAELERAPARPRPARLPPGIDATDAAILACAAAARADIVVTGDRALLRLAEYSGVPILSPRDLWRRLQKDHR